MFDPLKSLEKHLGEFDFNSRVPHYNDDSDYTTNAPSYYDDLARKNKLIKHLAMRIWDYDKELQKRFNAWDKNLEEFDDEVLRLLKEWMEDGTFDHIINEVLFGELNDKIDDNYDKLKIRIDDISYNLRDFGVIPDGVTDNTVALKNALTQADGNRLIIPNGIVKINGDVNYNGKVNLIGSGNHSIIDLSDGGSLNFISDPVRLSGIATPLKKGTSHLDFNDRHELTHGDVFVLYNPRDFSWSDHRYYYRDGCMFEVNKHTSTSLDIFGVSPENYSSELFEAWKLTGQGVKLNNFKVIPNTEKTIQIFIDGHVNVKTENITIPRGSAHTGIDIYRCYNVECLDINADTDSGNSYPIIIANSQKINVSSNSLTSSRHSVAIGGRDGDLAIPVRNMTVYNSTLLNGQDGGVAASDMHGNVSNIRYINCTINSVANMAGKDVSYKDCVIYGRDSDLNPDGNTIWGGQVVGGTYNIDNCKIISSGTGRQFGFLQFSLTKLRDDFNLNINNLYIDNDEESGTARTITLMLGSEGELINDINININGLTTRKEITTLLFLNGENEITDNSKIIINHLDIPEMTQIIMANNLENFNKRYRLPLLSGKIPVTLVQGETSVINPGEHKYPYSLPLPPNAQVSVYSRFNDVSCKLQTVYNSSIRGEINSLNVDGFEVDEDVEIHWFARVDTL